MSPARLAVPRLPLKAAAGAAAAALQNWLLRRGPLPRASPRQLVLAALALQLLAALFGLSLLCPAAARWHAQRAALRGETARYTELLQNLAAKDRVAAAFAAVPRGAFQIESDQVTLSGFLQNVEQAARQPRLALVSMKPGTPLLDAGLKSFPLRLSVNGPLPEALQFIASLLAGPDTLAVDGFTLRGLPAAGAVDAAFALRLLKICDPAAAAASPGQPLKANPHAP